MRISVVIPVFDGEAFVRECVESVLRQTHAPLEIIVVDDGSTDGTPRELASFGQAVRVLRQENRGRSVARNEGIEAATGDFVAFLDVDDRFLPRHLEQLVEAAGDGEAEIVHDTLRIPYLSEAEQRRVVRRSRRGGEERYLCGHGVHIVTAMIRRAFFRERDLAFEPGREIAEDALFFLSAILLGARVRSDPRPGTLYGVHDANTTRDNRQSYLSLLDAYDRLDAFAVERGLDVAPRTRQALSRGRRHIDIAARLAALYEAPSAGIRRALRAYVGRPGVSVPDRVRCLVAQAWPHIPFARARPLLSRLFGYTVQRTLDDEEAERTPGRRRGES